MLMNAVKAIAELDADLRPEIEFYNSIRDDIACFGLLDETKHLVKELSTIAEFSEDAIVNTASDELYKMYLKEGLIGAYSALDNGYRNGIFEPREVSAKQRRHIVSGVAGIMGYFVPRLPYYLKKGLKEM